MAPSEARAADVHVHVRRADLAADPGKQAVSAPESARADASHARVIPHLRLVDQGPAPGFVPDDLSRELTGDDGFGSALLDELEAARRVALGAAEASDWASPPMTPVEAIKQVAPGKGEAGNWIIWSAMTVAGLARVLLVAAGYLVARGGETRIRAGVAAGVFVTVLLIGWLAAASG